MAKQKEIHVVRRCSCFDATPEFNATLTSLTCPTCGDTVSSGSTSGDQRKDMYATLRTWNMRHPTQPSETRTVEIDV